MKKTIAILLTLALVIMLAPVCAETETGTDLTGGIRIGMNAEEILAAEGGEPDYDMDTPGGARDIEYSDRKFGDLDASHAYILIEDALQMIGFYSFADNTPEVLDTVKGMIAAEYGEASEVPAEAIQTLFTEMSGQETPFTFESISGWQADEDTVAFAFMVSSDGMNMIYVTFVSAAYLASIGL